MKISRLLLLFAWLLGLVPDLGAQTPPTNNLPSRTPRISPPGDTADNPTNRRSNRLTPPAGTTSTNRVFIRPGATPTTATATAPSSTPATNAAPIIAPGALIPPPPVEPKSTPSNPSTTPGAAQPTPTITPVSPTTQPVIPPPGPGLTQPAQPATAGNAAPSSAPPPAPSQPATPGVPSDDDKLIPSDEIKFSNMPIDQFLDIYASWTRRTLIRPATLPTLTISIKAQMPLTRKEAIQAFDSVLALNGYTIIPVGEKFATFVPNAQVVQEGAAFNRSNASDLPEAAQYTTQIIQLKHLPPSEVQPIIVPFAKNPTGIVAIDSSMILVLRDYAVNVKRMMEIIEKIDVVAEQDYKLEVIPIRYGKVEDIYGTMSSLTGGGGGVSGGTTPRTTSRTSRSSRSGTGSRGGMMNTLNSANRGMGQQPQQAVQPGQTGSSFQQRLQQIVNRAAGGELQLLGDARIVPDERSNSLLVYASKEDMKMITNIVAKVDTLLAQVLIEAIILEVGLDKNLNYGVSAAQSPKKLGGGAIGAGVSNNESDSLGQGRNFLGNLLGGTNALSSIPASGGLGYFTRFGRSWDVALTAIASDSTVNVLSRPRIQTTHAVPATFEIGSTVPYITGTYYNDYGGGGSRSQYQQLPVVTSLNVTPFITPDGLVVMELDQHIEELGTDIVIDGNKVPTTTTRSAASTVSVKDGEMILLGGFISEKKKQSKSGIPILKDIPGLGALFRSTSNDSKRTELIILMRPTVLDTAEKATQAARALPGYRSAELQKQILEQEKDSPIPKPAKP